MSVPTYEQNESNVLFIDTARELYEHTFHYARKLPKRATFFLSIELIKLSKDIFENVVCANKYYPSNRIAIEERYKLFTMALGYIETLDSQIVLAKKNYGGLKDKKDNPIITEYGWVHWGVLIKKEEKLIKAVLSSDSKIVL